MKQHRTFHYSMIEFRRNPADWEAGTIHLGAIIGFTTETYKAVGLAIRESLESSFLDQLDDLSKSLIDGRSVILEREIAQVLRSEVAPERVLAVLANRNPWSIHVTQPAEISLDTQKPDQAAVERIAQDYVFTLYRQALVAARPDALTPNSRAHSYVFNYDPGVDAVIEMPPVWMLPPKVWCTPNIGC